MAATDNQDPCIHATPNIPTAPYPPSLAEAQNFYYGLPSRPRLVARSSTYIWVEPTGADAYLVPKEASPLGFHPLREIWEATVGPAMVDYLDGKGVKFTSLDPVRMGQTGDSSPSAIVWIGVLPGSLTAEIGIEVAIHCKSILSAHHIEDVHIEIRESEVFRSAKMYLPAPTAHATAQVLEPFSTSLGFPISTESTPSIGGTGGFYVFDPRRPGAIYLVTARHVVIRPEENDNTLYNDRDRSRRVLLFSDPAIEEHLETIKSSVSYMELTVNDLEKRLEFSKGEKAIRRWGEEMAKMDQDAAQSQLNEARKAVGDLKTFLTDVSRDWGERNNRLLGHVVLSPPISFGVEKGGFTEDWAVIEVDKSKVDSTNCVGNAIDLGSKITKDDFKAWIDPANPLSFDYPVDRLYKFHRTIPDEEMGKSSSTGRTLDHEGNPIITVVKNGSTSGITIGRLNNIRSFTRYDFCEPGTMSKEVAVLPRNSDSGAFSYPGDSGSVVIDGKGRLAGLLTGGTRGGPGFTEGFDFTYVTSINFLLERMSLHGLEASLLSPFDV